MDYTSRLEHELDKEPSYEPAPVFVPDAIYFATAEVSGVAGVSKMTGAALNELDAESGFISTLDQIGSTWYLNGAPVVWSLPL